ncbi:MAG: response regulator [Myxococcaceae bacterium]|nr:response regulator [Myxococcaceae bacterium]
MTDKRSVLVVDDEAPVRVGLQRLLERGGYTVHLAAGGEEGLSLLRAHPIQLVISDKDMPGMSGIEFLSLVHDRWPRVCRILLTGYADLESAMKAINEDQVFRYLEKPWNNDQLLNTVHFAFESLELQAELERERRRSQDLLLSILPGSIADRLKRGEKLIADRYEAATVLFSDLVAFTPLSSRLEAKQVVEILNDMFSAFDKLAGDAGVEKIKTIGDGYLAASGLPVARPDHVVAAADLALDMLRAIDFINASRGTEFKLRIGLHTGPVVAGVIGLKRFSYDLWGDTVNVASRMEATGVPGRVHVTAEVRAALSATHVFEARGLTELKGKGPIPTWLLLGRK